MSRPTWEQVGSRPAPSWYLDPLVAGQKRGAHLSLIRRWTAPVSVGSVLKTDLFEEAFGGDYLLPGLFPGARLVCAIDQSLGTVRTAKCRFPSLAPGLAVMDVSRCALRPNTFELILSNSTLDHFDSRAAFLAALAELGRSLSPGGLLILTLDNPLNPLYHPLRWFSRVSSSPFPLGYTPTPRTLRADLRAIGLHLEDEDWLLHNPRGLSTALFLALRKALGSSADRWVGGLLAAFEVLGRFPFRPFTACFFAVAARRP